VLLLVTLDGAAGIRCVGYSEATVTQRVECVAVWSSADDGQTYAVLRHDSLERAQTS